MPARAIAMWHRSPVIVAVAGSSSRRPCWPALLVVLVLLGCVEDGPARADPFVRDSGGVRIVENGAPVWRSEFGWRIRRTPALEIGHAEGAAAYQFHRIVGVLHLPGGTLAVANRGSAEIRLFDGTGRHVRTMGGRGSGPGEFRDLVGIVQRTDDSILGWDQNLRRLSVFTEQGDFAGSFGYPVDESRLGVVYAPLILADGSMLVRTQSLRNGLSIERSDPEWLEQSLLRLPDDGGPSVELGTYAVSECLPGPARECWRRVHAPRGTFAAAGDQYYYGRSDLSEIQAYSPEGSLVRIIRWPARPQPVTAALVAEYRAAVLEGHGGGVAAELDAQQYAEFLPVFSRFLVDALGYVWVEDYRPELALRSWPRAVVPHRAAPIRWTVFDPDGLLLGDVELPPLEVHQIGADFVLGVATDELGVERVRVYELERTAG
jgi:hypothetical protein